MLQICENPTINFNVITSGFIVHVLLTVKFFIGQQIGSLAVKKTQSNMNLYVINESL